MLEVGKQGREVVVATRGAPCELASRRGARTGLDEIGRHRGGVDPLTAHRREIGALPLVHGRRRLGIGEALSHVGRRDGLVREQPQRTELRGAELAAALRHHRLRVPLENVRGAPEEVVTIEALNEQAVGRHRGQSRPPGWSRAERESARAERAAIGGAVQAWLVPRRVDIRPPKRDLSSSRERTRQVLVGRRAEREVAILIPAVAAVPAWLSDEALDGRRCRPRRWASGTRSRRAWSRP